jgi:thiol:disulfide interchange protein
VDSPIFAVALGLAVLTAAGRDPAVGPQPAQEGRPPGQQRVYDEAADARAQMGAALARAKKDNKRVLVQWGANWCGWCVKLHELCRSDSKIASKLLYEYEIVRVDVGRFDKNLDLAAELGADFESAGVPFLTVLGADGKPLAQQETGSLEVPGEGRHDPAKVLAFLEQHQAPYLDAQELFDAALAEAKARSKRLFVHLGAPW